MAAPCVLVLGRAAVLVVLTAAGWGCAPRNTESIGEPRAAEPYPLSSLEPPAGEIQPAGAPPASGAEGGTPPQEPTVPEAEKAASGAGEGTSPQGSAVSEDEEETPESENPAEEIWTEERMREAQPYPMPSPEVPPSAEPPPEAEQNGGRQGSGFSSTR
jgi:hypothetical protein